MPQPQLPPGVTFADEPQLPPGVTFADEAPAAPTLPPGVSFADAPVERAQPALPPGVTFADEAPGPEATPLHETAAGPLMEFFSGEFIRSGAQRAIQLETAAREASEPRAARLPGSQDPVPTEPQQGPRRLMPGAQDPFGVETGTADIVQLAAREAPRPLQFLANVAAGLAGFAGAKPAWRIVSGVAAAREGALLAGRQAVQAQSGTFWETDEERKRHFNVFGQKGGYTSKGAIARALVEGNLSEASWLTGVASRAKTGGIAFAWGLNPAIAETVMAEPGERMDAFLDALETYPVESTAGFVIGGAALARVRGKPVQVKMRGKPFTMDGEPVYHGETPVRGQARDLQINAIGMMVFDRTPDFLKGPLWGTESPAQRVLVAAQENIVPSEALRRMRTAKAGFEDAGGYERMYQETKVAAGPVTELEARILMVQTLDGTLRMTHDDAGRPILSTAAGDKLVPREAVSAVPDEASAEARGDLGKALLKLGLEPDAAELVLAAHDKTAIFAMGERLPEIAAEVVNLSGRGDILLPGGGVQIANLGFKEAHAARKKAQRRGKIGEAIRAGAEPEEAQLAHEFSMRRGRQEAVPEPLVKSPADYYRMASDGIRDGDHTSLLSGYRKLAKKMASDVRLQAWMNAADAPYVKGYTYLPHSPDNPLATRLFDAIDAIEGTDFKMPISRKGAILNTTPAKLFFENANVMKHTKGGDAKLWAAISAGPEVRFISNDSTPTFIKWVAEQLADPDSPLHKHQEIVREQQRVLIEVHGMDPLTVIDHFDAYLSRQWTDVAEAGFKIAQDLKLDLVTGSPMRGTGPRFKRKLGEKASTERLIDFMANDPSGIGPVEIAKFSVDNTQMLIEKVAFFKEFKRHLSDNGLVSDTERPGFTRIMGSKDAKPGGIGDPYNFMFGELANAWVPDGLARQLRGIRDMYRRTPALLTTWKLVRTTYNPMGYHLRNELGDFGNVAAISGHMPGSRQWRGSRARADHDLRQLAKTGKRSDRMAILEEYGGAEWMLVDDVGDSPLAKAGNRMATAAMRDYDGTPESIWQKTSTVAHLLRTGDFPAAARKAAPEAAAAWDAALISGKEAYMSAREGGAGVPRAAFDWTTAALRDLNKYLASNGLARYTMRQEYRRRLFSLNLAMDYMGMSGPEAVQWVKNTLHDYGDKPAWLANLQTNKLTSMALPPFLTYGYKQGFHQLKAAVNNPELFFLGSLVRAMNASDFADMMPNPSATADKERDAAFASMWQFAHLSSFGASRKFLGTGKDISEAMQDMGFHPKLVRAMAGYDRQGVPHPLALTLPLRDISNLNTLINDMMPGEDSDTFLARINPFVDLALTALDPDLFSRSQMRGANPTNRTLSERAIRASSYLLRVFTPAPGWYDQVERIYQASASAAGGELKTVGKRKLPVYPLEAITRVVAPGISISAIDHMNMIGRVQRTFKYKMADLQIKTGRYTAGLERGNPDFEGQDREATLTDLWMTTHKAMLSLRVAYMLHPKSVGSIKSQMRSLRRSYDKQKKAMLAGRPPSVQNLGTPQSNDVSRALQEAVEEAWTSKP